MPSERLQDRHGAAGDDALRKDEQFCEVIDGRPDFHNCGFGVTLAKTFPPYVFSVGANAGLVHKVVRVELRWWVPIRSGHQLGRLNAPRMTAHLACGEIRFLKSNKTRTCLIPNPRALLCGRCHGEPATFGKHGVARGMKRAEAHVRLGCVVKGY